MVMSVVELRSSEEPLRERVHWPHDPSGRLGMRGGDMLGALEGVGDGVGEGDGVGNADGATRSSQLEF
jgi:hypothetical protein